MTSKIDLHCHTTASDGRLEPPDLVRLAHERGISILAITDHDTTDGLAAAQDPARQAGITLINGVEFACEIPGGEIHILGYLFDPQHPALVEKLAWLREGRQLRGQGMVDKLAALGVPVSWARVQEIAGTGSVGRPHVAQALVEAGHVADTDEAFSKYLAWGRPAYASRRSLSPGEVIALLREAGGVASLAHPARIPNLEDLLRDLAASSLVGLETYYGEYDTDTVARLAGLAARFNLVPTGGSDYHARPLKDHAELGAGPNVPPDTLERLRARQGIMVP